MPRQNAGSLGLVPGVRNPMRGIVPVLWAKLLDERPSMTAPDMNPRRFMDSPYVTAFAVGLQGGRRASAAKRIGVGMGEARQEGWRQATPSLAPPPRPDRAPKRGASQCGLRNDLHES